MRQIVEVVGVLMAAGLGAWIGHSFGWTSGAREEAKYRAGIQERADADHKAEVAKLKSLLAEAEAMLKGEPKKEPKAKQPEEKKESLQDWLRGRADFYRSQM